MQLTRQIRGKTYRAEMDAPAARLCGLAHLHLPGDDPVM
jgi:hypothetical protein